MTTKQTTHQRAARLPAPVPGQVLKVSLELLPAYMALHGIRSMGRGEVTAYELAHRIRKEDGVLWVSSKPAGE